MKYLTLVLTTAALLASGSAMADPEKGKKDYKKCAACHSLKEGKKKVGPSLFKLFGRQAGTVEGFKYSKDMAEAGTKGLTWTPENLVEYLEDPKKYLAAFLKKDRARSKMLNKFKKLKTRQNIVAYLSSLQPDYKKEEQKEAKTKEEKK